MDRQGAMGFAQVDVTANQLTISYIAADDGRVLDRFTITLTASDGDGDPLTWTVLVGPAHGTLTGEPPNLQYDPAKDYFGPDSIQFKVHDGFADSPIGAVSITANSKRSCG